MKKILILLIMIFGLISFVNVNASEEETYEIDFDVDREMRAVWISPLVSDIPRFTSETQYKNAILDVFTNMEKFNLNTMIFHIRIYNDALYESTYNNWSSYYNTSPSWDALPWIIEECHNRGYEFHAWMNPYRVASTGSSLTSIASRFPKSNLASNPANLLKGSSTVILNPGIPEVQDFLVNVCMEVVYKYDVDAIHFDDYFYVEGIDDTETYGTYGIGQGIEQFRRDSVDTFIKNLKNELDKFNKKNNACVELGISPTAAWANGDGVVTYDEEGNAISNGSKGVTQGHYGNYLYCDTLKWVNEDWIDYILPQCYIGTSQGNELFYGTVDWWSKVCKYSKTKLYIGIGLYRASSSGDWSNLDELKKQFDYMAGYDNVEGFSIFSYKHIKSTSTYINKNLENAKEYFENEVSAPLILKDVENAELSLKEYYILNDDNKHSIGFTKLDGIKYYILLKKINDDYELLDIYNSNSVYVDTNDGYCEYYIAPVLHNNTIGRYVKLTTEDVYKEVKVFGFNNEYLYSKYYKEYPEMIDDIAPVVDGYRFVEWEKVGNNFQAKYEEDLYKVTYYVNEEVYYVEYVKPGEDAKGVKFDDTGGKFSGWDKKAKDVQSDVDIYATFIKNKYTISFYNGSTLLEERVYEYGDEVVFDIIPEKEGYQFVGFMSAGEILTNLTVTRNLSIYATFTEKVYKISYDLDGGTCNNLVTEFKSVADVKLPTPLKDGYKFIGWYELDDENNELEIDSLEKKDYNLIAKWAKIYNVNYDLDGGTSENLITEFTDSIDLILPEPVKEGYKFVGWYEDIDDNLTLVNELINKDYTLVAKWEISKYTITYKLNGGKAENLVNEFTNGEEVILSAPEKDGYKFIGWYELVDGELVKVDKLENRNYILEAKYEQNLGCANSMIKLVTSLSILFIVLIKRRK